MSAYKTLPLTRRPHRRVHSGERGGGNTASEHRAADGPRVAPGSAPQEVKGFVHSVESFGTLDGPGIRYVVFFQGCHLRCLFCQNRDTWQQQSGKTVSVEELMGEIRRYKRYMISSGGGITASGGDPILQPHFVASLFRAARKEGLHTALDTSGVTAITPAVEELLAETDLVLLDIKHIDPEKHRLLTGHRNDRVLALARHLSELKKPMWIRHVIVPGFTDMDESARATAAFIETLDTVERVDLLPYHEFGSHKWEALGERYPLQGVKPPDPERVAELRELFQLPGLPVSD